MQTVNKVDARVCPLVTSLLQNISDHDMCTTNIKEIVSILDEYNIKRTDKLVGDLCQLRTYNFGVSYDSEKMKALIDIFRDYHRERIFYYRYQRS
jgi:hypothetical protein